MAQFNAPIPGQSLTDTPGNGAWERPPQLTNPEDALHLHLDNLNRPEAINGIADLVNSTGISVKALTNGILRNAVAGGKHSIDVSMLIAPILHEQIKGQLDTMGIAYDEGFDDEKVKSDSRVQAVKSMVRRVRKELSNSTPIQDEAPDDQPLMTEEPQGQGLVSRPDRGGM